PLCRCPSFVLLFFPPAPPTCLCTLSLHDALPISRSIALLLVLTGLRIGELLALRWKAVDLTAGTLRVIETVYDGHFDTPKTDRRDRKSTRLNSSHQIISYAVFCLKKQKKKEQESK